MRKPLILFIILLFVCWNIYNLRTTEGFDTPPENIEKCEKFTTVYKNLEDQYDTAIKNNNEYLKDGIEKALESMKKVLQDAKCNV